MPTTQRLLPFAVAARKYGSKIAPAAAPKAASSSKAIKPGPEATNALVKRMRETRLLRLMQELLPDLVDEAKEKLTAKQQVPIPQTAMGVNQ
ncbi:MAG: hypothetical protein EBS90_10130 [Betaproteobacteria bacterium]|nr:hypothetical protein [Betaproteobacteria bacterium]